MSRLLVISPHLDDAVFGCGDLIGAHPGAVVVTVFAGGPRVWDTPTDWDTVAGFGVGENAVARRRGEDRQALAVLQARPVWLPFWDSQYGASPSVEEVACALDANIRELAPDAVAIPFGLWHSDHRLAHEAARRSIAGRHDLDWLAYEDAIYRRFPDSGLAARADELRALGFVPVPPAFPASADKRASMACYRSQLRALAAPGRPGWADALAPESRWAQRPPGCQP